MSWPQRLYDDLFRSDLANIVQVSSGVAALYAFRKFVCKVPRCPRIGKWQVQGTTYRTCSKHTTAPIHEALINRHEQKRPEQHALLGEGGNGGGGVA